MIECNAFDLTPDSPFPEESLEAQFDCLDSGNTKTQLLYHSHQHSSDKELRQFLEGLHTVVSSYLLSRQSECLRGTLPNERRSCAVTVDVSW